MYVMNNSQSCKDILNSDRVTLSQNEQQQISKRYPTNGDHQTNVNRLAGTRKRHSFDKIIPSDKTHSIEKKLRERSAPTNGSMSLFHEQSKWSSNRIRLPPPPFYSPALKKWGLYWICLVCPSVIPSFGHNFSFPLNILRTNGHNLTKFCIHINIDKI